VEEIAVRELRPSDVEEVVRLEREIFSDPWPESAFRREAEGEEGSWSRVALDGETGRLLGYLVAWFVADEAHLANVAVIPGARRGGVAQRLLDDLIGESHRRRGRMVILEVRRSNHAAQGLYRKNGFYTVVVRRRYYRDNEEDALVMIKPLAETGWVPPGKDLDL
jgi:ribosomal-protein-alanine N-acetyltransferase